MTLRNQKTWRAWLEGKPIHTQASLILSALNGSASDIPNLSNALLAFQEIVQGVPNPVTVTRPTGFVRCSDCDDGWKLGKEAA